MKKLNYTFLGVLSGLLLSAAGVALIAQIQDVTSNMKLTWSQNATSLAQANAMRVTSFLDGSATGVVITQTCTGSTSPFTCSAPMLSGLPTGSHNVTLTSEIRLADGTYTPASPKSVVCNFRLIIAAPEAPFNLFFVP